MFPEYNEPVVPVISTAQMREMDTAMIEDCGILLIQIMENAGREHYEAPVRDMVLAESQYPGWLSRLLSHPVSGPADYQQAFRHPNSDPRTIKVLDEVAPDNAQFS